MINVNDLKTTRLSYIIGDNWNQGYLIEETEFPGADGMLIDNYYTIDLAGQRHLIGEPGIRPLHGVSFRLEITGRKIRCDSPLNNPGVRVRMTFMDDNDQWTEKVSGWMEAR